MNGRLYGTHDAQFKKNRKKILATQDTCGICGKPVDKTLRYPNPMAPCVDHIIPIARGGHPSAIDNLQLAHWACNRAKSDKMPVNVTVRETNRNLPLTVDWRKYRGEEEE